MCGIVFGTEQLKINELRVNKNANYTILTGSIHVLEFWKLTENEFVFLKFCLLPTT